MVIFSLWRLKKPKNGFFDDIKNDFCVFWPPETENDPDTENTKIFLSKLGCFLFSVGVSFSRQTKTHVQSRSKIVNYRENMRSAGGIKMLLLLLHLAYRW